jgi:hypothetical protein
MENSSENTSVALNKLRLFAYTIGHNGVTLDLIPE